MSRKSTAFKKLAALAAALILLAAPAAKAAGANGQEIVGTVPRLLTATSDKNARCTECTMGDAVADAVRKYLDADFAIVCGGDLKANLLNGEITWDALRSLFAEGRTLTTATVTVRQLREILEAGVSHVRLNDAEKIDTEASAYDGFPQISGFTLDYDASAPVGQRVYAIYVDGEKVPLDDETRRFTLGATVHMLEGGYGLPSVEHAEPSDLTLADVTGRYIQDGMDDYLRTGYRIHAMGTAGGGITGPVAAAIIIAVFWIVIYRKGGKKQHTRYFRYYPK